jgi:hypothetical protein
MRYRDMLPMGPFGAGGLKLALKQTNIRTMECTTVHSLVVGSIIVPEMVHGPWEGLRMKPKMAVLKEEIDLIHYANKRFWEGTVAHSSKASSEYYQRQDRLEAIRRELADACGGEKY